ncbi:MAG: YbaB/EbfC family nucleoid-associated protein [Acidobacteria bacterium]|nr:YbaB/EbfC family nucleoid-associated protein [Acidobacteriota bacterium]
MNIKQLMRQAQEMQEQMQQKMASVKVEGTSGGGMVKAVMSGAKELVSIEIDREAVDPEDVDMLQDLIVAAVNEAGRKVDEEMSSQMGGVKLPGM